MPTLYPLQVTASVTVSSGSKRTKPGLEEDTADQVIKELRGANEVSAATAQAFCLWITHVHYWKLFCWQLLVLKTQKLEQLVRLKDAKINTLSARLREAGLA